MARLKMLNTGPKVLNTQPKVALQTSWRTSGESSTARGYGYKWQKAREGHLRSHPWCVMCLAEMSLDAGLTNADNELVCQRSLELGKPPPFAQVVDHRVPHRGDMAIFWDKSKWDSLCTHHHSSTKQRLEQEQ